MIGARRVIRWAVVVAAVLMLPWTVGVAGAGVPPGPRLAVVMHTWKPSLITLLTVNPDGARPGRVGGGDEDSPVKTLLLAPLSWHPDGTKFAFTGLAEVFLVKADRSGVRRLNIAGAEMPVFAPDGNSIAFTRGGREAAIWTIDLPSGTQRQLTPYRRGLRYFPSSYSPDGTTLLATRFDGHRTGDAEPVALHLDTGGVTRLLRDGREPVYSPDGSEIALFRVMGDQRTADLFALDVASGALRRLTRTPDNDEFFASWDPSGERIAFTRFQGVNYEWANSIVQINADGTCETEILARRRTLFFGAAWQPGPGREAGRIDC